MNARFDKPAVPTPASERLTRVEIIDGQSTDTDFRLPDEPNLPPGYTLTVGGQGWYDYVKTGMDLLIVGVVCIVSLPLVLISALLVRLTSRGPAFYTQVRVGRGGQPYVIYKLRSMYHDCERFSGIRWSTKGDNRVTPFGKFLRKSHIDELPQLWNVLKGEMSLIGPRPERPELVGSLEMALPRYRDRLLVKPGVTGLAQIQLPPDSDIESVRKKLVLDRVYVNHRSLWLDIRIYVATAFYLAGLPFTRLQKMFALPFELKAEKEMPAKIHSMPEQRGYPSVPVLDQV
jgi:lipopolysaccharide/colanic/teichoic acid biosynthesis glycosyltransferase